MFDPFGSFNGMIAKMQEFFGNPMQFMMSKGLNIPNEYANNPDGAIQYLMNNGRMTQQQYNWLKSTSDQIQRSMGNQR